MNWPPNWRNEKEYPDPDPKLTTRHQWAWEFLRRNKNYQDAWKKYQSTGSKPSAEELKVKFGVNALCDFAIKFDDQVLNFCWSPPWVESKITIDTSCGDIDAQSEWIREFQKTNEASEAFAGVLMRQPDYAIVRVRGDRYVLYLRLLDAYHDLDMTDDAFLRQVQPDLEPIFDTTGIPDKISVNEAIKKLKSDFAQATILVDSAYLTIARPVTKADLAAKRSNDVNRDRKFADFLDSLSS